MIFFNKKKNIENEQVENIDEKEKVVEKTSEEVEIAKDTTNEVSNETSEEKKVDDKTLEKVEETAEEFAEEDEEKEITPAYERYSNIDWRRISPQKILSINSEIMLENKRLIQEKMQNKIYTDELEKQLLSVNSIKSELNKVLDDIAGQLFSCSNLIMRINNGEKLSIRQKADLIVKSILTEETNLINENQLLYAKIKEFKIILNNLQQQVYELTIKKNAEIEEENQRYTEKDIEEMINITPKSQDIIITATPLNNVRNVVEKDEVAMKVLKLVGKDGYSEVPEIVKILSDEGISDNRVEDAISTLQSEKVVIVESCKPFNRSSGVRLLELSKDIGEKIYRDLCGNEPVECEMRKIIKENDNIQHGYSIKDVYIQLLAKGYDAKDVIMDRKQNTITVSKGITYIPDIVAKHPLSKQVEYYEIETGKCNQKDFYNKLEKACLVCKKLRIIVPNRSVADDYFENVKFWFASKQVKPAITIVIFTFKEFKDKAFENARCYPKPQKEDLNVTNEIYDDIKKKGRK